MDNPRYVHLFSPQQRAHHAARPASPTPPPWGGIGDQTPVSNSSSSADSGDEDDVPHQSASMELDSERETQMELVKHFPPAALSKALALLFNNGK